ncbi:hypothetical protein [Halospeciosus flavus]|uniref:Uncharacterized protein n=1 Tax=Halospeciosus flavus TaxID=3032283 RepID=A0ABD5Z8A2_9EURY|nr:hypothetical protein [Halospeciosus flavus]
MEFYQAKPGVEVGHETYGRGVVRAVRPQTDERVAEADVYFYEHDAATNVPLLALEPAAAVTRTDVTDTDHGLTVTVDDGLYTVALRPDGEGGGFEVTLSLGNATLDSAHLSTDE